MRIGTTPTHEFVLPLSVNEIQEVEITYCQNKKEILKKHTGDCALNGTDELGGTTVSVKLSQEDTFSFHDGVVEIQVRVLTTDGTALASDIMSVSCKRCLSDEVL